MPPKEEEYPKSTALPLLLPESSTAGQLIKEAHSDGTLRPFINFGSTRHAIKQLCDIKVDMVQKIPLPASTDGDVFVDIRAGEKPEGERPSLKHMVFFLIKHRSKN